MEYFINYDVNTGVTITSARAPGAWLGDIGDLAQAVALENENVCCALEGAKDTLEDGAYWSRGDVPQDVLEEIHAVITEFEDNENEEQQIS